MAWRREAWKEETLDPIFLKRRERAIVNQTITNIRTVSKATLGNFLRDKIERIWAFPSACRYHLELNWTVKLNSLNDLRFELTTLKEVCLQNKFRFRLCVVGFCFVERKCNQFSNLIKRDKDKNRLSSWQSSSVVWNRFQITNLEFLSFLKRVLTAVSYTHLRAHETG